MRRFVFMVCVAAVACVADAPVAPTTSARMIGERNARSSIDVPFAGTFSGTESDRFQPPATLLATWNAQGTATHLGRFTSSIDGTVDLGTGSGQGTFAFVAANGDRLFGTFTGQAAPTSTPGVVAIGETAIITGGTGRFAGAVGRFTIERSLDQATGLSSGSFRGSIDVRP